MPCIIIFCMLTLIESHFELERLDKIFSFIFPAFRFKNLKQIQIVHWNIFKHFSIQQWSVIAGNIHTHLKESHQKFRVREVGVLKAIVLKESKKLGPIGKGQ